MELNRPEISHEIKGSRTWISTGPTKPITPTPEFPVQELITQMKGMYCVGVVTPVGHHRLSSI